MTTAKLDAPVNKLARLLNSQSIKRVLLNDSLTVDFDRVISGGEVLVVKGALGVMGAGNTSVLMQLLVGMLDAALARQQDLVSEAQRVAVALKVDEAPLVLNRGFAETMALKRSAGLETVACWQTDAQWTEREVRDQLDALFAHRVYFATASVARCARGGRADDGQVLRHCALRASSISPRSATPMLACTCPGITRSPAGAPPRDGKSPFVAETIPLHVDAERLAMHAARQEERGGRYRTDLRQPHWDREHAVSLNGREEHGLPEPPLRMAMRRMEIRPGQPQLQSSEPGWPQPGKPYPRGMAITGFRPSSSRLTGMCPSRRRGCKSR